MNYKFVLGNLYLFYIYSHLKTVNEWYSCPRCLAVVCELPIECPICSLSLVSSPFLARSYHHLFPIKPFEVANDNSNLSEKCFSCLNSFDSRKKGVNLKTRYSCQTCKNQFCLDCDIYIHQKLHVCPGC